MADRSYTDDEIRVLVLDADKGFGSATLHTYQRLMRERDEARRVAKVLAIQLRDCDGFLSGDLSYEEFEATLNTALAYPEPSE